MEKIKFRVDGNQIALEARPAVITAGTVGLEAEFTFDSQWDTLSKMIVFKAGEKVVATALAGNTHSVPWEVLEKPNRWLCVGVYGANRAGTVVIPTLWAKVSVIHTGTDPEGDPALESSAPIWQEALYLAQSSDATLEAAVENMAAELCPGMENPTLADISNELMICDRHMEYILNDHADNRENPHNVTCDQLGAATLGDLIDTNVMIQDVSAIAHNNAVDIAIHTNTDDNPNPHEITCEKIGAVTTEQHDIDIQDTKDLAWGWAEDARNAAMQEISDRIDDVHYFFYTKKEADVALEECKAVIVTVDGTTPSHTSQEIYALIQAGKVVYLQLWGNTYIICSACTESEAKFENSVVTNVTGADGKTYNVQRFRLYFIKNDRYASPQTIESPSIDYLNAQIQYYLNQ